MYLVHPQLRLKLGQWKTRWILFPLLLMTLSIVIIGCSIGVKEKQTIVYASFAASPEEAKGAIKIATNKLIPVTIEGEKDIFTKMELGGYYAVSARDLKAFINAIKKVNGR